MSGKKRNRNRDDDANRRHGNNGKFFPASRATIWKRFYLRNEPHKSRYAHQASRRLNFAKLSPQIWLGPPRRRHLHLLKNSSNSRRDESIFRTRKMFFLPILHTMTLSFYVTITKGINIRRIIVFRASFNFFSISKLACLFYIYRDVFARTNLKRALERFLDSDSVK